MGGVWGITSRAGYRWFGVLASTGLLLHPTPALGFEVGSVGARWSV